MTSKKTQENIMSLVPGEESYITIPGDLEKPQKDTEFAHKSAKLLVDIIKKNNWSRKLGGQSEHIQYEGWQTAGKYYGYAVKTFDAEYVEYGGVWGFKAKATVVNEHTGIEVGGAEALCMSDEYNWKNKPKFQLASMAQTRAGSKALRQILGFVVALAGFNPTPAEEMDALDSGTNQGGGTVSRGSDMVNVVNKYPKPGEGSRKPITYQQKGELIRLLGKLGKNQIDLNNLVKEHYSVDSYQMLTVTQANEIIRFLEKKLIKKDSQDVDPSVQSEQIAEDVSEGLDKEPKMSMTEPI